MKQASRKIMQIVGGPKARHKIAGILGLGGAGWEKGKCPVIAAKGFDDSSIRVNLQDTSGAVLTIIIKPPKRGESYYLRTKGLLMQYEGDKLLPGEEKLLRAMGRKLESVEFSRLWDILYKYPEKDFMVQRPPADEAGDAQAEGFQACRTVEPWGDPEGWRRFIFRKEFARNSMSSILLKKPLINIMHGDLECRFATPLIDGRTVSLYNYPWVKPFSTPAAQLQSPQEAARWAIRSMTTDLQDNDVIMGGSAKLEHVLTDLSKHAGSDEVVVVKATCVPHIIGDDMEACVRRWKGTCPIYFDDPIGEGGDDLLVDLLKDAIGSKTGNHKVMENAINLIGFPTESGSDELRGVLEESGIHVNVTILPDVDPDRAGEYFNASVQVLMPQPYYARLYEKVFLPGGMRTISPPAPYGVESTRRWLSEVARAVDREASMQKVWKKRWEQASDRWAAMQARARKQRLGFVVSPDEYDHLFDPAQMAGIPVMDLIEEMGFQKDFFVYGEALAGKGDAGGRSVHFFRTEARLQKLIEGSDCRAVYSDLYFDDRITRSGKTPFSLQYFEVGLSGAVRTLRRLLGACELPFYRKYSRGIRYEG